LQQSGYYDVFANNVQPEREQKRSNREWLFLSSTSIVDTFVINSNFNIMHPWLNYVDLIVVLLKHFSVTITPFKCSATLSLWLVKKTNPQNYILQTIRTVKFCIAG